MTKGVCPEGSQGDFSQSFMYSVHQLHFAVQKHLEQMLISNESVTFSQFIILVGFKCPTLANTSQQELARSLELTEATVSRHIATLVSLGYMERTEDPLNRRRHILDITEKGEHAYKKAKTLIDAELDKIFSTLTEKDKLHIMETFKLVLTNLSVIT